MTDAVRIAFERKVVTLPFDQILPVRKVADNVRTGVKYKRIVASIAEVGIIEPMVVARLKDQKHRHLLLDGYLRLDILKARGDREGPFVIADDDETFTYNKRVNQLATVQEHYMVLRAIERGVPPDKLARAFDLHPRALEKKRTLLDGICPEVVDMLKDRVVNQEVFIALRKMKPVRQIEATEFMLLNNNLTAGYAKALVVTTPDADLVNPKKAKAVAGVTAEQIARLEREMDTLKRDIKQIEDSYGNDVLHLVIARGFLSRLLANAEVVRYMERHYPEFLVEFHAIVAATALDQSGGLGP